MQAPLHGTGLAAGQGGTGAVVQRHGAAHLGVLALLQLAQLQQAVDEPLQPLALLHDLGRKLRPVGGGQVFLQQLARATDRGHGAFELMGECAHIAFDVVVPL